MYNALIHSRPICSSKERFKDCVPSYVTPT